MHQCTGSIPCTGAQGLVYLTLHCRAAHYLLLSAYTYRLHMHMHMRMVMPCTTLPLQGGFADSLNASVAAALARHSSLRPCTLYPDPRPSSHPSSSSHSTPSPSPHPSPSPRPQPQPSPSPHSTLRSRPSSRPQPLLRKALHTLLGLYGARACGDLAREAPPAEVDALRRAWARQLARDEAQVDLR